jgi:hypothetical protein
MALAFCLSPPLCLRQSFNFRRLKRSLRSSHFRSQSVVLLLKLSSARIERAALVVVGIIL